MIFTFHFDCSSPAEEEPETEVKTRKRTQKEEESPATPARKSARLAKSN